MLLRVRAIIKMITIEYCPLTGKAIPDGKVEIEYQDNIINNTQKYLSYSTGNIFSRIRLGIVKEEITHNSIRFFFNNEYLYPNRYGALLNWPDGFCDTTIKY